MQKSAFVFLIAVLVVNAGSAQDAAVKPAEQPAPVADPDQNSRFVVGISYTAPATLTFSNITASNVTGNLSASLNYSSVLGVDFESRFLRKNAWGVLSGGSVDFQSSLTGGTVTGGGTTIAVSGSDPSRIMTTVIYLNAAYRWETFYLPFGINYSLINYSPPSTFNGSVSANGGIGAQVGLGFYLSEKVTAELYSRAVAMKLSSTSAAGVTTDYGTGFLSALRLSFKYIF